MLRIKQNVAGLVGLAMAVLGGLGVSSDTFHPSLLLFIVACVPAALLARYAVTLRTPPRTEHSFLRGKEVRHFPAVLVFLPAFAAAWLFTTYLAAPMLISTFVPPVVMKAEHLGTVPHKSTRRRGADVRYGCRVGHLVLGDRRLTVRTCRKEWWNHSGGGGYLHVAVYRSPFGVVTVVI